MRVLLCGLTPDDERALALRLGVEKVTSELAEDGDDALDLAKHYDFDAVMVGQNGDLEMPVAAFVRKARNAKIATPIVVLMSHTNHLTPAWIADVLNDGADDVVRWPADFHELHARLQAVVRRSQGISSPHLDFGNLRIDLGAKTITVAGKACHLTAKEYGCLEALARKPGATLTKEAFLNHLYGGMDEPEIKIIDVFLCKLRKKLREAGWDGKIATVWGRGYRMGEEAASNLGRALGDADPIHSSQMEYR